MENNFPFIRLISSNNLPKDDIKTFYTIAKNLLPSGIIASYQDVTVDNDNRAILLKKGTENGCFTYTIPLSRNLLIEEIEPLDEALKNIFDFDFDLGISSFQEDYSNFEKPSLDNIFYNIAKNIARYQHTKNINKLINRGWRYGPIDNEFEKISSTLLPFDSLGEELQNIDLDLVREFIKQLQLNGFIIEKLD